MSTPFLKGQNLLANSRLTFWQRGTSYLNADNGYQADRFRYSAAVQADYTRNADVPTPQADYSINISRATAIAITGANYCRLHQPIEGNVFRQIRGGKFTLFFWAKSSKIGPRYVYLRNSAFSRYFIQKYEITVADTWQSFQFQLTHDETGAWLYDTGVGMDVNWITQAGPTAATGTVGSWQNGALVAASDQVNTFDANNSYFRLALPMIVPGHIVLDPNNLPLDLRYDEQLRFCQRYFFKSTLGEQSGYALAGNQRLATAINFPVEMRTTPAPAITSIGSTINIRAPNTTFVTVTPENSSSGRVTIEAASSGYMQAFGVNYTLDAEL